MCIGMMGFNPNIGLHIGDELVLKAGSGRPKVRFDRIVIVASVDGGSALTTDGTMICCLDEFEVTGNRYDSYTVTDKAKKIAARVGVEL